MTARRVIAGIGCLALCAGCASVERAVRLNWPRDSYAPPALARVSGDLRSEAGQELALGAVVRALRREGVALPPRRRCDLWPLFYKDDFYWSLLWPLVDADRYGFAVRPLIDKEGDEWSAAAGLIGWNGVRGTSRFLPLYRWGEGRCDILGILARGRWNEDGGEFRVLEYLFRADWDARSCGVSWLWRFFQLKDDDGNRSGFIFFIPFGG